METNANWEEARLHLREWMAAHNLSQNGLSRLPAWRHTNSISKATGWWHWLRTSPMFCCDVWLAPDYRALIERQQQRAAERRGYFTYLGRAMPDRAGDALALLSEISRQ